MEHAFGTSLGGVQLHSDENAASVADGLGVRAFAVGDQVALPGSITGPERQHILAHEVAHVVQQRGGSGAEGGDPEQAADQAARAFVAGEQVPAQPAAARGVARYASGATAEPVVMPATTIGNQQARDPREQGSRMDLHAAAQEAGVAHDREMMKAWLEAPTLTKDRGGASPTFITKKHQRRISFSGKDERVQRDTEIDYEPRRFHAVDAIKYDVELVETVADAVALWTRYLEDAPQAAPWDWETARYGKLVLPDGAAATQLFIVDRGRDNDDPNGATRYVALVSAILARAEKVAELAKLFPRSDSDAGNAKPSERDPRKRPVPTLRLPVAKAPHLDRYEQLAAAGRLIHEADYERKDPSATKQRKKWNEAMGPGGSDGITPGTYADGKKLVQRAGRDEETIWLPNWTWLSTQIRLHVDHIVELQLTTRGDRGWANTMANFELLDESSNTAAGPMLDAAIWDERERLFKETGDHMYLEKPLAFERVVLVGGSPGQRWSADEIRHGTHLEALRAFLGGQDDER